MRIIFMLFIVALLFFTLAVECASASIYIYPVTAISNTKILPTTNMSSYTQSTNISMNASLGEITCESFVINSDTQISDLNLTCSDFTGSNGKFSVSNIDFHWVKCWWQGSYGTYPQNTPTQYLIYHGYYLTPELLLHDDSLVIAYNDTSTDDPYTSAPNGGNNAVKLTNGTIWNITDDMYTPVSDIQDTLTLQSITLPANYNKQVWITLTVPNTTEAGTYTGTINLKSGENTLKTINVTIIIYPFELLSPTMEYGIYSFQTTNPSLSGLRTYCNLDKYAICMQDIFNHGVTEPTLYNIGNNDTVYTQELAIRQQIGINNTNIYNCSFTAGNTNISHYLSLGMPYGVVNYYQFMNDEQYVNNESSINLINDIHNQGGKVYNSQTSSQADVDVEYLDVAAVSLTPNATLAAKYHSHGHKIFSYADPQTGPEYPRTFRQNYGLLLWQNDYDGAMDYGYQCPAADPWNDFDMGIGGYRDHMMTYPTVNGCLDTIQWEGFREAVNDVRYLATLQNAIADNPTCTASENANSFLITLKTLELENEDLDLIRSQIANYAIYCQKKYSLLRVNSGSGTGFYKSGNSVQISANQPMSMVFLKWTGDIHYIDDVSSAIVNVSIPSTDITLNATYTARWYAQDYSCRELLCFKHTMTSKDQTNFTLLINDTDPSLKTVSNGGHVQNAKGYDIIYMLPDGTKLDKDTEYYNSSTGTNIVYVRVPLYSATTDTYIYRYYNSSKVTMSTDNDAGVYGSKCIGVWHSNSVPTMFKDSTIYRNNGTATVNIAQTIGQVGGALKYDGYNDYVIIPAANSLNFTEGNFTISYWMKASANSLAHNAGSGMVICKGKGDITTVSNTQKGFWIASPYCSGGYTYQVMCGVGNGSGYDKISIGNKSEIEDDKLHQFVVTCNSTYLAIYKDGVLYARKERTKTGDISVSSNMNIGRWLSCSQSFNGTLDEIKIWNTSLSADTIKALYKNQYSPNTYTYTLLQENVSYANPTASNGNNT